jgi:hypothetical protein
MIPSTTILHGTCLIDSSLTTHTVLLIPFSLPAELAPVAATAGTVPCFVM